MRQRGSYKVTLEDDKFFFKNNVLTLTKALTMIKVLTTLSMCKDTKRNQTPPLIVFFQFWNQAIA